MKIQTAALLALMGTDLSQAFLPSNNNFRQSSLVSVRSMVKDAPAGTDVSVPYDAGARLAYDDWREQFGKGKFDEKRYDIFKTNYETITVANVSAKKKAREEGTSSLTLMSLNEYGDLTEEEYRSAISSGSKPMSTGDVLSKAVENAELQSEASSALSEAADALAEEERLLAEKLGLKSVEELEMALDSSAGIAPDGGELDSDNLAREARVRDAYLKWCKEFGKEPNESRFPAFSNNFLLMEEYRQETNKDMNMNEFADCTMEEYAAIQGKSKQEPERAGVEEKLKEVAAAAAESVEEQLKQAADALRLAALALGDDKDLDEAQLEIRRLEREEAEKEAAKEREQRAKLLAERAKVEAERRTAIDQERAERLKKQEALMAKKQAELEASVIAAARAEEARQATASARTKKTEIQAATLARKQAQESEAKLKRAAQASASVGRAQPKKKVISTPSVFAALVTPPAESNVAQTKPLQKTFLQIMSMQSKGEQASPFSFFKAPEVKKSPTLTATPTVTPKVTPQKKAPATPSFSFFSPPAPAPAAPKVVPVAQPQKKAAPATPSFSFFSPPAPAPAPAKPSFSFFSPQTPAPAPPKVVPVVQPQQKKATPAQPSFSFFSAPAPAPAPAPVQVKIAPVIKKEESSPFSFFGKPAPAAKIEVKAPTPVVVEKPAFSFFSSSPSKDTKIQPKMDIKVPNQMGSISIFGATPKSIPKVSAKSGTQSIFGVAKAVPKKDVVVPNRRGTLSVTKPKAASTPVQSSPTFSLFGNKSQPTTAAPKASAPPKNVPVLSRWRQNSDGSITGIISNSANFKTGTQITTSPVGKGAKGGSLVKTGSGSQYYLN